MLHSTSFYLSTDISKGLSRLAQDLGIRKTTVVDRALRFYLSGGTVPGLPPLETNYLAEEVSDVPTPDRPSS